MTLGRAAVVGVALLVGAALTASGGPASPGHRTILIDIDHSKFAPGSIRVSPGQAVRFVIRNHDPIDHEFILGDQRVQAVHESGHQAHHARPGEVSVPAGATVETTYTFRGPGGLLFGCHLPGHWSYGMHGTVLVL